MSEHIERQLQLADGLSASLRVAFASGDHKRVDQHFGSCEALMVYGVAPDRAELLQVTEFRVEHGHSVSKLETRMEVIAGCFAVFCVAVGESVFRQLLAAGVRAIRVDSGTPISQLIRQLQQQWPANADSGRRQQRREQQDDRLAELANSSWDDE
ncbi:NifB/NifX family molybdenum-iron cluster-binding protein [Pseudaeromonas sharmana]|uniref:NifB/NifX family molybdenum-iron cluster-binding protein n=1 Tax=Pseudaeromonas sharmana TaxID=328412 RepID=A0ABV8CJU9_9GAMM